jgi:hypothetical protein
MIEIFYGVILAQPFSGSQFGAIRRLTSGKRVFPPHRPTKAVTLVFLRQRSGAVLKRPYWQWGHSPVIAPLKAIFGALDLELMSIRG